MLGFPAPDIDPRKLATDCDELDRRLVRWLDLHCGGRDMRREGDRCVLVDRGQEISIPGQALDESSAYEDSVRKSLQVAIDRDYFEAKTGRKPGPND